MKLPALEKTDTLLALFGLSFIVFGWFALTLTLGGLFLFPLVAIGFALSLSLTLFIAWRLLSSGEWDLRAVFVIALLAAVFTAHFTEPTIFSGRDQGSIAEAAWRLAHNGELAFSTPGSDAFFQIYGEGTALNFPGFAYTKAGYLITQFPLGYTAWLASFVSLFGLTGYAIANAVLFFLTLVFLYQLLRLFVVPYYALAGLALSLTAFLPSWFAKITLTENLAVFLFVFLAYNLILFFREGKFIFYAGILLTGGFFAFTRIEGFAFLFIALALITLHRHTRSLFLSYPWKSIVIPGLLFSFILLRDFFLNLPYYKMIGKALEKSFPALSGSAIAAASDQGALSLGWTFFLYGLFALFFIGIIGILVFLKRREWLLLIPAAIALPTFFYLFHPTISADAPWMLRRFLFSLFPTLLFSAVLCIAFFFTKKKTLPLAAPQDQMLWLPTFLFVGLILLQYPAWHAQVTYAEQRTLRDQLATFTESFSPQDLILIDRDVTGSGFAMISGPGQFLFGKNTVYFFNPFDLSALDTSRFQHIYLLTPKENQGRYAAVSGDHFIFKKSVTFTLEQFEDTSLPQTEVLRLPDKATTQTTNLLYQIY